MILSEAINAVEGETIKFDNQGNGSNNGDAHPGAPFKVVNNSEKTATIGFSLFTSGVPTSFFVSNHMVAPKGTIEVLPIQKFSIFFGRELRTNTMYDNPGSPPFEFYMTGYDEVHLECTEGNNWVVKSVK